MTSNGGNNGDKPSLRARTIVASAMILVILIIILGQAFGQVLFGVDIDFPVAAYPVFAAAVFFWFGLKLSDITGPRKD